MVNIFINCNQRIREEEHNTHQASNAFWLYYKDNNAHTNPSYMFCIRPYFSFKRLRLIDRMSLRVLDTFFSLCLKARKRADVKGLAEKRQGSVLWSQT